MICPIQSHSRHTLNVLAVGLSEMQYLMLNCRFNPCKPYMSHASVEFGDGMWARIGKQEMRILIVGLDAPCRSFPGQRPATVIQ